MKKLLSLLMGLFLVFVVVGSANAIPFEDIVDWDDRTIGGVTYIQLHENDLHDDDIPFLYEHSVDFNPAAQSIQSADLFLRHMHNNTNEEAYVMVEGGGIHWLGALSDSQSGWVEDKFTLGSHILSAISGSNWTIMLELKELTGGEDGIKLDYSKVSGEYNPVPEPATMMLFGMGLLGLAGITRNRKKA
ncbi:PEP-CTERM sorting domain-containing protein [Desulfobacterales bacterium HSG17]|nr:PEP-CTERM sorting domain-containing protein [Desulfobacterales bacterium HSG17]